MTMDYICPRCVDRTIPAGGPPHVCEVCGGTWKTLVDLAEERPKTEKQQQTLASVTTPGDQA